MYFQPSSKTLVAVLATQVVLFASWAHPTHAKELFFASTFTPTMRSPGDFRRQPADIHRSQSVVTMRSRGTDESGNAVDIPNMSRRAVLGGIASFAALPLAAYAAGPEQVQIDTLVDRPSGIANVETKTQQITANMETKAKPRKAEPIIKAVSGTLAAGASVGKAAHQLGHQAVDAAAAVQHTAAATAHSADQAMSVVREAINKATPVVNDAVRAGKPVVAKSVQMAVGGGKELAHKSVEAARVAAELTPQLVRNAQATGKSVVDVASPAIKHGVEYVTPLIHQASTKTVQHATPVLNAVGNSVTKHPVVHMVQTSFDTASMYAAKGYSAATAPFRMVVDDFISPVWAEIQASELAAMSMSSASFLAAAGTKALQSAPHVAEGARVALMPAAQGAAFVAKGAGEAIRAGVGYTTHLATVAWKLGLEEAREDAVYGMVSGAKELVDGLKKIG